MSQGAFESVCSSREVELENQVSELRFQLNKVCEEKKELERSLQVCEEHGLNLTTELNLSHKQVASLTTMKGELDVREQNSVKKQCCNSILKVEALQTALEEKDAQHKDTDRNLSTTLKENNELKASLERTAESLEKESSNCERLKEEVKSKSVLIKSLKSNTEEMSDKIDLQRNQFELEIRKLKTDLLAKDEEIRNMTEETESTAGKEDGLVVAVADNSFAMNVNDVSVDDNIVEENRIALAISSLQSNTTPARLSRGPSASSTPNKGRLGSIAEELKEFEINGNVSPLCERKANIIRNATMEVINKFSEEIKKIVVKEVGRDKVSEAFKTLDKEIYSMKMQLEEIIEETPNYEELKSMKEEHKHLQEKLDEANIKIENIKNSEEDINEADITTEEIVDLSTKVDFVASLLKVANSGLLTISEEQESLPGAPEFSSEAEMDLSNWQLDLEGIQLVDLNTQLSKKLLLYNKVQPPFSYTQVCNDKSNYYLLWGSWLCPLCSFENQFF